MKIEKECLTEYNRLHRTMLTSVTLADDDYYASWGFCPIFVRHTLTQL